MRLFTAPAMVRNTCGAEKGESCSDAAWRIRAYSRGKTIYYQLWHGLRYGPAWEGEEFHLLGNDLGAKEL